MKLRDLAERTASATEPAEAPVPASLPNPDAKTSGTWQAGPPRVRWLVLESRLLDDEQFLVVLEKKHLKEARKAHPGKVIYFPPEIDELYRHKDSPDYAQFLKTIHLVKKKFGGWIIPSDSPLARRLEPPKGGDTHGTTKREKRAG